MHFDNDAESISNRRTEERSLEVRQINKGQERVYPNKVNGMICGQGIWGGKTATINIS